jgi:molybdopterin-guanine dinucleotide biosynthesis protein A
MPSGYSLVILAGGRSRRMGRDKAALPAGDGTMVEHLVRRLGPVADEIIVATGSTPAGVTLDGVQQVDDRYPGAGPLAGMHAGFLVAHQPWVWVVGCDLPDVEPGLGRFLLDLAPGFEAVVPRPDGEPEGVCALYDRNLLSTIQAQLEAGEHSIKNLMARCRVRIVPASALRTVDPELRSFRNVNTTADYEAWLRT